MADRKRYGSTPTFDELYDCARHLQTCEVVLERVDGSLELQVRCLEDLLVVHDALVRTTVEDAAVSIREGLEREHGARS